MVCFEIIHEFKNENLDRNKIFSFVEQTLLNLWRNIDCEIGKLYEIYEQNVGVTGL